MSGAGHIGARTGFVGNHVSVGPTGVEYDVIIEFESSVGLPPDVAAATRERIERAREAAERVLQGRHIPLPADLETAIAEVLEARRRPCAQYFWAPVQKSGFGGGHGQPRARGDLQPRGTTQQAQRLRTELIDAVDALGALLFDEEEPHA